MTLFCTLLRWDKDDGNNRIENTLKKIMILVDNYTIFVWILLFIFSIVTINKKLIKDNM